MEQCAEGASVGAQSWPLRRQRPRHTLRTLAYVTLDQGNGGIVRDLSEAGAAVQAVAPLQKGQEVSLRFDLISPRVRVETRGRVAWAERMGQAGIEFAALSPRLQRALKDWLLYQLFSSAAISGRDTIFDVPDRQFMVSAAAERLVIMMEPEMPEPADETPPVRWGFLALRAQKFSICIDALVLLCAVLVFAISSLAVMGGIPAWPLAVALLLTSSAIFVAVYQIVFSDFVCGATPGKRLAYLARRGLKKDEPAQRFR